jgi:15-hydroxyprostaglandin dehydrogenase (NAD)
MVSNVPTKTAIITGACSGIGLALTRHLLSSEAIKWRVVLADIDEKSYEKVSSTLDATRAMFQRTDVSSWEDNALLFKSAFEWSSGAEAGGKGRIDFLAANAGTDDKEFVYSQFDLEAEPAKPNLTTIDVNLLSAFYGLKLFIHYARKTGAHLPPSASFKPAMVITASSVGLYQFPLYPQYCAAKYGLVGLTRSVGRKLLADDNISVNAILPGLVATGLPAPWMITRCPPEYMTPMSTILRAYDDLMEEEVVDGKLNRKTAQCLEATEDKLYYRQPVEYPTDSQRWLMEDDTSGGFIMNESQPQAEQQA